jgi:hypothetical protein
MPTDRNPPNYPSNSGVFLTELELASRQNRSVKTIQAERVAGRGVPFVKLGRSVRYRLSDIESYEAARLKVSTADKGARNE